MQRLLRIAMLCCMLLALAVPAWAAPNVEMSVQPANQGVVKMQGWTTVLVELSNRGGDLTGELVVESTAEMQHPQYVVPVALPSGATKRVPVTLMVEDGGDLSVKLNAGGEVVTKESVSLTSLPPQAIMIGVLSGDELGIPALSQMQAGTASPVQVIRLAAESFPEQSALLKDFNLIALSRVDTSTLSPTQLQALEGWVAQGGTLLVSGGPEWRRTMAPLPPSLVPVEVTGVQEVSLAPLSELGDKPLTGSGSVSTGRLLRGQSLVMSGGVPLIATAPAGAGKVVYLAFDPGLTPVVGWAGQTALFNRVLVGTMQIATDWMGNGDWMIQNALRQIPDWAMPSLWLVALLLLGYLLLVGPANYLVLKRMDKREWSWVSVPLLSVLFLGVVYLMGFGRFQPLVSHLITVTELAPGVKSASMSAFVGLYAPSQSQMSVDLGGKPLVRPLPRSMGGGEMVTARVVNGERTSIELLGMNNYSMSGFRMEQDVMTTGGLELVEAEWKNGTVTGRLKNSLAQPVADVTLNSVTNSVSVGRLEPGQTSEPFSLAVGNMSQIPMEKGGWYVGRRIGVMNQSGTNLPDEQRRQALLDYLFQEVGSRGMTGLMVTGWTDQPLASPDLPDLGKLVEGANLIYSLLPIPLDGETGDIPAGVILGRPTDIKGADRIPNGYLLRPGRTDFSILMPSMDRTKVESIQLDVRQPLPNAALQVSVKNQMSGEWVALTGQTWTPPDWQEFVSAAGLIELAYQTQQPMEIQPPTVSVKGVGR